ncbi:hypothetical protein FRB95_007162 [Tulasnella sp. JGI-2019a]|nr:hypothetical protein FRB95_007162 [Tulasnella sp. JGI-2019a]
MVVDLTDVTVATFAFVYRAFIGFTEGPDIYYSLVGLKAIDNQWIAIFDFSVAGAALSGDILLMWRCYVIWGRNKRVIVLPVLQAIVGVAGCIMIVYDDATAATRL